jgi:hypothetical protein
MQPPLSQLLNSEHPLCSDEVEWNEVYALFSDLLLSGYEEKFVRLMSSLVMLERLYELTPAQTLRIWSENPYWQAFSGFQIFHLSPPASEEHYAAFRKIAGKQRLLALAGLAPSLEDQEEDAAAQLQEWKSARLGSSHANAADIRRSLLPQNPAKISADIPPVLSATRHEPHFETTKPCLVDGEEGKPLVLQISPLGEGPFSYQWFRWSQDTRTQEEIPEARSATFSTRFEPHPFYVAFRCLVKNSHSSTGRHSRWFFVKPQPVAAD